MVLGDKLLCMMSNERYEYHVRKNGDSSIHYIEVQPSYFKRLPHHVFLQCSILIANMLETVVYF